MRLGSVTVNAPHAGEVADFYAGLTGGEVTFRHTTFATVMCPGGRIDIQTVEDYVPPRRAEFQPNSDHCLVFLDPVGHPFCLTTVDEMG